MKFKRGSILILFAILLSILSYALLKVDKISKLVFADIFLQLREDAKALSVEALCVETLNQVSWINKQLDRIALLTALVVFYPELVVVFNKIKPIIKGIEYYQDYLLKTLPYKMLYYDKSLSFKNKLRFNMQVYTIEYRRKGGLDLGFIKVPGLIEFNKSIFTTVCIRTKTFFANNNICSHYAKDIKSTTKWFTPKEESWYIKVVNEDGNRVH